MIYEVCELLATHLRDGAMGVNALIGSVPLAAADPALEAVTVVSEFEIPYVPGTKLPDSAFADGPLVLVRRGDDTGEFAPAGNPEIANEDGRVGVALLVVYPRLIAHGLDVENRRLSATLRAVRRSLALLFEERPYEQRELRGVQVVSLLGAIRVVPTVAAISEVDAMAGAILLDMRITDRWAEGTTPLTP